MNLLREAMKREGAQPGYGFSLPRFATISSYDPTNHSVKVQIQPEGTESNWMPLGCIGIGSGWGVAAGPQDGDHVVVVFPEGDFNSGVIIARLFSVQQQPLNIPSGEVWAVHQTGSFWKLTNDGHVRITAETELDIIAPTINVTASGNVNVQAAAFDLTGPLNVTGPITATGNVTAGLGGADQVTLQTHKHPTAATGSPSSPTAGT